MLGDHFVKMMPDVKASMVEVTKIRELLERLVKIQALQLEISLRNQRVSTDQITRATDLYVECRSHG